MEEWRVVTTWDREPGFNMALDEAFLLAGEPRPTLRFYTWRPDALSLGYFQRLEEVRGRDEAGALVRRLTGGGAIHHRDELTFAIATEHDHPLYRGAIRASYERVHDAIAVALARLGVSASRRGDRELDSDDPTSPMCFHHSTPIDLVWNGAKGVGSAQRRTRGRVLHHGSIKIGTTFLEGPIAVLRDNAPTLDPPKLAELLTETFRDLWKADLRAEDPTPAELAHTAERAAFFTSPEHLGRR